MEEEIDYKRSVLNGESDREDVDALSYSILLPYNHFFLS